MNNLLPVLIKVFSVLNIVVATLVIVKVLEKCKKTKNSLKFKKLKDNAVVPTQANPGDAGFDLTAITKEWDGDLDILTYGTGLAVEIPEGHVGLLFPRSSVYKTGLSLANCVGVIDSGYRGEIMLKYYIGQRPKRNFNEGERVGQLVVMPYAALTAIEASELSETKRGVGGFGSSGK